MTNIIPNYVGRLRPTMTVDEVMEVKDELDALKAAVRDREQEMKAALIDYINEQGSFEFGGVRYYVGPKKKTTCPNVPETMKAIILRVGGDVDALCDLLSSQPIKHGAARGVLEESWPHHFTTEIVDDLKTGKPTREVKTIPTTHTQRTAP